MFRLPSFGLVEGANEDEDDCPVLNRLDKARGVRASLAEALHLVHDWDGGRGTEQKVALCSFDLISVPARRRIETAGTYMH